MKLGFLGAACAAAALSLAALASPAAASTSILWTGPSDFDNDTAITFAGVQANTLSFTSPYADNFCGGFGSCAGYAHTHGGTSDFQITAVVDGVEQTIFSGTTDFEFYFIDMAPVSFSGGLVTSIGFDCQSCNFNTFHGFFNDGGDGTFGGTFLVLDNLNAGVPEPATWALMIGGFGLAGAGLRRRKAVAA